MKYDLVSVEGNESFVTIDILYGVERYVNDVPVYVVDELDESRTNQWVHKGSRSGSKQSIDDMKGYREDFDERSINKITAMKISRNMLTKNYSNEYSGFNGKIDMVLDSIGNSRARIKMLHKNSKEYKFRVVCLDRLHRLRRKLMIEQSKIAEFMTFDIEVIKNILRYLPQKFYEYRLLNYHTTFLDEYGHKLNRRVVLKYISIRDIAIPYIEQQHQLERIELSKKELAMIHAMKNTLSIKDESMTFEKYIDDFAERILEDLGIKKLKDIEKSERIKEIETIGTCKRNHILTKENIYIDPKGKHQCRACRRIRKKIYYEKNKRK